MYLCIQFDIRYFWVKVTSMRDPKYVTQPNKKLDVVI